MRLEEKLGEGLKKTGFTISVAESCTGGLLASRITDVPGSSAYFRGGIVAYQDEIKERLLGVSAEILKRFGAVSEETARAMTEGVRKLLGADLALAITGIAGPGGATEDKPVGLVYVALSSRDGREIVRHFRFEGNRQENKRSATEAALHLMLEYMIEDS